MKMEKPKGVTWTDDQWQAITADGSDILVAAAAGSGKTAVLVERIIKKVLNLSNPVDVDRLLVVTFTNAAAAEMRKRIGEALEKALTENPSSLHLRRQLSLLNRSSISTLHSFCMEVIRKYYYRLYIDPRFRIADDMEAELLREEVMEELFEEQYSMEDNGDFFQLVDWYSNDRSDSDLQQLVRKLVDFSKAYPYPNEWLENMAESYQVDGLDNNVWIHELLKHIDIQLKGCQSLLSSALEITKLPDGPAPYAENILEDMQFVELATKGVKSLSWNDLYQTFSQMKFSTLKRVKKDECNGELQDQVKQLRETVKKQMTKLRDELFSRTLEQYLEDIQNMEPVVRKLVHLVQLFDEKYMHKKIEKGIVDFNDLEHLCLQLLGSKDEHNEIIASDVAKELQQSFVEVYVDEYQDVNLVQETILQLITKGNNMFMVGDVKQSIYRFRLAEPGLFLGKYKRFSKEEVGDGLRIDLAKNFRSRQEVIDGTNYIFKQIMNETVGEIAYDDDAELKLGAAFPETADAKIELNIIHREGQENNEAEEDEDAMQKHELETAQLEGRMLAKKIKEMITARSQVMDKTTGSYRNVQYRDIVILLRSLTNASTILEELKDAGIPAYAELSTGYFEEVEVSVMLSVLKVIDNPYQDIPLASVLRSPIVGLNEEELANIRIVNKTASFYEALKQFVAQSQSETSDSVFDFLEKLESWRTISRHSSLSKLIWHIYQDTKYFDFVGGMPGGKQRQANLRALFDRAKQYESTSFRGLFRFLRFVERLMERGDDLGVARALGEQEDVVRMMTIHKSKGLEFPVVFVAGMNKQFNMMDVRAKVLLHKELGFGSKFINEVLRVSYPTLPQLAIKTKMQLELIAEEMRVLYVALTRAKEKLILVGTIRELEKTVAKWTKMVTHEDWVLPDFDRAQGKSYLDWVGPALVRHREFTLPDTVQDFCKVEDIHGHSSKWLISFIDEKELVEQDSVNRETTDELSSALRNLENVEISSNRQENVTAQLEWQYPYQQAMEKRSKQTVSDLKRQFEVKDPHSDTQLMKNRAPIAKRPRFMQKGGMTSAEKGTAMHAVMQNLLLDREITRGEIESQLARMLTEELLLEEQREVIDVDGILQFFQSELGGRVLASRQIYREVPFSLALPASVAYADWHENGEEKVLIQGIVDLIFEDETGLFLVDYKTDTLLSDDISAELARMKEKYAIQVGLYKKAISSIWNRDVHDTYLYLFDGGHAIRM